ncbi:DUF4442 domain-containing protein [Thalassotalea fusca]
MFKYSWLFKFLLNYWPPFLLTGIHITKLTKNFDYARVELRMRFWNKNAVGTHFGGSLFAMTDPFYMLLLMARLGKDYYVWDKFADIDYVKPGKGVVHAEFHITDELINDIKKHTESGEKYLPVLPVRVVDEKGDTVVTLNRTLYIRKKKKHR